MLVWVFYGVCLRVMKIVVVLVGDGDSDGGYCTLVVSGGNSDGDGDSMAVKSSFSENSY